MRRSTRLEKRIPILVTSLDPSRRFCEECETVAINAHGCGVIAPEEIATGSRVLLDLLTDERHANGGVVVDTIALSDSGENWLIGIELEQFGNFWGLSDPPSDWGAQTQAQSSLRSDLQEEPISAQPRAEYPVHLTDLSPSACYLETPNPFPVGSALEVEFVTGESQLACSAVVRLVHPQAGMGLEFTPSDAGEEQALLSFIDLLINGGHAADVNALVRLSRQMGESMPHSQPSDNFGAGDSLLALILCPGSLNKEHFLEELRLQRVQSTR